MASDIADAAPWAALGSLDAALNTSAGIALAARMLLAGVLWALLFRTPTPTTRSDGSAIALSAFAILGTWAWAGHSSTQRWAELGMPVDIAHHAAAALWIAGLLIVGLFATQQLSGPRLAPVVERLSTAASVAVAVIVLTGIIQSLRLVGSPGDLFAADHGKYLAVKLVVVAAMLGVAALNRRSVRNGQLRAAGAASSGVDTQRLRRSILVEFALGLDRHRHHLGDGRLTAGHRRRRLPRRRPLQPAQLHCVVMRSFKPLLRPSRLRSHGPAAGASPLAACGGDDDATAPTTASAGRSSVDSDRPPVQPAASAAAGAASSTTPTSSSPRA